MENNQEDENLDLEGKYESIENYLTCEYSNQELNDNNIIFRKWKNSMQKIYGKNGKVFRCKKDSIYFYVADYDFKKYPIYQSQCPKCFQQICYYCSVYAKDSFGENGTCCLKRKIKCMFYQDCYRYIKPIYEEENLLSLKTAFKIFIIPIISLLNLITQIQGIFYYKLKYKKGNTDWKFEEYFQHSKFYGYIVLINVGIAFSLVVPLFLIHIYFIIFLLLISIPFKFIPLKYFLGMHYATVNIFRL